MSTNPIDVAHAAVDLRPRWLRQYAKIMRSRSTALAITRGRKNAFVPRALASSVPTPPSRATTLSQSWVSSDSRVIPLGYHKQSPRASAILAPMRESGDPGQHGVTNEWPLDSRLRGNERTTEGISL